MNIVCYNTFIAIKIYYTIIIIIIIILCNNNDIFSTVVVGDKWIERVTIGSQQVCTAVI